MEKAKEFFKEVIKTEEAKALFASIKQPETDEARIAAYLQIAKKLNFELTLEDIIAYFSVALDGEEVDDNELSQLIGGIDTCSSTFEGGEFCWFNDSCKALITTYDSETGKRDRKNEIKAKQDLEIYTRTCSTAAYLLNNGIPEFDK